MARPRTVSSGLPDRVYLNKDAYYYRSKGGQWLPLGTNSGTAAQLGKWLFEQEFAPIEEIPDTTAFELLRRTRASAQERNIACDLMAAHVQRLFRRASGRCEVTGIQFSLDKPPGANFRPWAPSIDRIDCRAGYTFDNVRLVCVYTNIAMNELGTVGLLQLTMALQLRNCWKKNREFLEISPEFSERETPVSV